MKYNPPTLASAVLLLIALSLTFLVVPNPGQSQDLGHANNSPAKEEDPDLPAFMRGKVNDAEYLRMREEYILRLRGFERGKPFDPYARSRAIRLMEGQKQRLAAAFITASSGPNWISLGPAPIPNGQTAGTSVPVSGRVTAVAVDPSNSSKVYVGTAQGGVYRSLDGGSTWKAIFDTAQSLAIGALALAPSNPSILYVGTGEANFSCDSFAGVGLYRINGADTTPVLVGPIDPAGSNAVSGTRSLGGRTISKILVHPANPAEVFVTTANGIIGIGCDAAKGGTLPPLPPRGLFRSTNATSALSSITFTKLKVTSAGSVAPDTTGNRSIDDMVFEPGNPNNLLVVVLGFNVANDGGIYRSTNALATTPSFTQTFVMGDFLRAALAINKISSVVTVYAATAETAVGASCFDSSQAGLVRKSVDGGKTWSAPLNGGRGFCGGQCFYDIGLAVDPADSNNLFLGGSADSSCAHIFQKSSNGGSSFASSDFGLHADTHVVALDPASSTSLRFGSDGGIWQSLNSGSLWNDQNTAGFSATQFESLAVHPTSRNFTIGGTQDNGTNLRDATGVWRRIDFGDGGYSLIDQNATDTTNVTMYHTYFNQTHNFIGFARVDSTASASDGTWPFFGCGFGTANGINCNDAVLFYAPMARGPGNPNTIYFGTDRLYRSMDKGLSMNVVSQAPLVSGVPISAIGISRQNDKVRIVGLANGRVFATTTGSSTLANITGPIPAKYVARAIIDPNNANTAYVTLAGYMGSSTSHVWKTTNLSTAPPTWVQAGSGIPDVPVDAFVVDPNNSATLYAGTDIGVYRSTDGGVSWAPFGIKFPVVAVFDLAIQNTSRVLRIATHGRGLWETSLLSADLVVHKSGTPNPVSRGNNLSYTITVSNLGPNAASKVHLTDAVPAHTTYESSVTTGTCTTPSPGGTGTLSCTVASLSKGATLTFTMVVKVSPTAGTTISNTAKVTSSTFDPNLANNSASVITNVNP